MSKPAPATGLVYDPEKKRFDRVALAQGRFDDFVLEANVVDTVVLLLRTSEEHILAIALQHLDQFAEQMPSRYGELHKRGILGALLPLRNHALLNVRRFAMKMLSQMFSIDEAAAELTGIDDFCETALKMYIDDPDDYLCEYAAIVLNRLTDNANRLQGIVGNVYLMAATIERIIKTNDPDILLHSLILLSRICDERTGLDALCARSNFPFVHVLKAIDNPYKSVQIAAMRLLVKSAECANISHTRNFEQPSFIEHIFEVLENVEREHLHDQTLQLLRQVLKQPTIADAFCKDVSLERFCDGFVKDTVNHRLTAVGILTELAQYSDARPALFDHNFIEALIAYLKQSIVPNIAMGIARMAAYKPALDDLIRADAVAILCAILAGEPLPMVAGAPKAKAAATPKKGKDAPAVDIFKQLNDRKEIALCLAEVFRLSDIACNQGIGCGVQNTVAGYLLKSGDDTTMPIDLRLPLIQILNSLAGLTTERHKVMTDTMAQGLYKTLEISTSCFMFMVDVLRCAANYVQQEPWRDKLMNSESAQLFIKVLSDAQTPIVVKKGIVDVIVASHKDAGLTDMFIDKDLLDCLLLDNDSLANCPNWSTAIEVILANNLPIKFALRGHLETSDCVTNEFYATKKIWNNYRRLRQIFCSECSARRPIFLCNFELPPSVSNLSLTSAKLSNEQSIVFNNRPLDRQLPDYLRILREALEIAGLNERQTPEQPRTLDDIRRCVELISDVVCTKICSRPYEPPENDYDLLAVESFGSLMSGETECTCTDDLDDVIQRHLDELKREQYDCNVIPLGAVRVGGFFEKSLLFKVLADKIGLPCGWRMCALDNRVVWNEVYMPDMDSGFCDLTAENQHPTHIVDLMGRPGNLYAIGSQRALHYQLRVARQ